MFVKPDLYISAAIVKSQLQFNYLLLI